MWIVDGLRGALAGAAVCWTFNRALEHAVSVLDSKPHVDAGETVAAAVIALRVGVPASLVVAFLVAWAVRLPRPWAVSLLGLIVSLTLIDTWGALDMPIPSPRWPLAVTMVVLAYALAGIAARASTSDRQTSTL